MAESTEHSLRRTAAIILLAALAAAGASITGPPAPVGATPASPVSYLAWVEDGEVHVARGDGTNQRTLTDSAEHGMATNEGAPLWTPSGDAVVVQMESGFAVVAFDGDVTALPGTDGWYTGHNLGISPDGSVLGIASDSELATVPLDGSAEPTPIDLHGLSLDHPAWSPDGTQIAFSTQCCDPLDTDVYVVDVSGGAPPLLISDGDDFQAAKPVFSPDGNKIAFEALFPYSDEDASTNSIVVANADGSGTEIGVAPRSTSTDNRGPKWSPDSSTVAFQGTVDLGSSTDVFTAPADGGAAPTVRSIDADPWHSLSPDPFSPEGSRLLYSGASSDSVANLAGGAPTELPFPGAPWGNAVFDPDGEVVADVTSIEVPSPVRADPSYDLYTTAADGTGAATLISEGVATAPSWSPPVMPAQQFVDVPLDHPFFVEIDWLVAQGITTGFPDGTFRPGTSVTRQAMAAFLYRLAGEPAFTPPASASFTDVPTDHPFFAEIEWLVAEGVTGGFPNGTFRPGNPVTRQAMAAFLFRFAGEPAFTPPAAASFTDVPTDHPFFAEIEWLVAEGIAGGFPDGTFKPTRDVTRQAMASFLYNYVHASI